MPNAELLEHFYRFQMFVFTYFRHNPQIGEQRREQIMRNLGSIEAQIKIK
jgi:hypothetical protein